LRACARAMHDRRVFPLIRLDSQVHDRLMFLVAWFDHPIMPPSTG
jgi:hypothetical protein